MKLYAPRGNETVNCLASVIVTAWNGRGYIEDCLDSLLSQSYPIYEVIVVDNASSDGTPELIAQKYKTVRLIRNEKNLGFAGGTNVGIRAAKGEILALFNQDAVADQDWLANMIAGITESPDIGVVGCKIYHYGQARVLWHAGSVIVGSRRQPILRGVHELDWGQYDTVEDVEAVVGAAMAVRRSVLDRVGLLDDGYFMYLEDTDLCLRVRQAGYRVVYLPQAVAYHHVAGSLGQGTLGTLRFYHRSRIRFLLKHFDPSWFVEEFLPAEIEWMHCSAGLNDYLALQEAYMWTIIDLLEHAGSFRAFQERFTTYEQLRLIDALSRLMNESIHCARDQAVVDAWTLEKEANDSRWRLREFPFVSSVPLLGPFISFCREVWNNMATRWYVRKLLEQQMQINWELNANLEAQNRLLRVLMQQIVSLQDNVKALQADKNAFEEVESSR
jgi:GT2 family glycosyltransferase